MKQITAVLIDGESHSRNSLKSLLANCTPQIIVSAEYSNLFQAIESIKLLKPNVVFFNLHMKNYVENEIANLIKKTNFEIIFVAANKGLAALAFELCAIDYLIKPINRNRLSIALKKLFYKIDSDNKLMQYQNLLDTQKKNMSNKLIIPENGNRRIIDTSDIIAIEADGSYACIYLTNNQKISSSKNLKYYEQSIRDDDQFFRSHRSWLINLNHIKQFNRSKNKLYLEKNIIARISRSNYISFDALSSFN